MHKKATRIWRVLGGWGLAGACALVAVFGDACLRPNKAPRARITPISTQSAAPATSLAQSSDTTTSATVANGAMRPGNPESLGEGARLLVGREFDPVYFDSDSTELDGEARRRLGEYVVWLRDHNQVWVALVGYCDANHGTKYGYNVAMARAIAAEEYLVANGLDKKRIYSIGYGPIQAEESTANRVEVLGFMAPTQPEAVSIEPDLAPEPEQAKGEDLR